MTAHPSEHLFQDMWNATINDYIMLWPEQDKNNQNILIYQNLAKCKLVQQKIEIYNPWKVIFTLFQIGTKRITEITLGTSCSIENLGLAGHS